MPGTVEVTGDLPGRSVKLSKRALVALGIVTAATVVAPVASAAPGLYPGQIQHYPGQIQHN